jgi:hypothetical protein
MTTTTTPINAIKEQNEKKNDDVPFLIHLPQYPRLVGLAGKKGTGKTTLCGYLEREYHYKEYSFADPLKRGLMGCFGLTEAQLHDPIQKETVDPFWNVSPRVLMQRVGTDCLRNTLYKTCPELEWLKGDLFVLLMKRSVQASTKHIVIADVRFKNEVNAIHDLGGVVVYIDRPAISTTNNTTTTTAHESESGLDSIQGLMDGTLINQATPADLFVSFDRWFAAVSIPIKR